MLKWLFRLLTVLSIAAAIALPFYFESFLPGGSKSGSAPVLSVTPERASSANITTVYKWRDSSGTWQYSDHPPSNASDLQVMEINSNVNILQSPRSEAAGTADSERPSEASATTARQTDAKASGEDSTFTLPQSGLPQLLDGSAIRKANEAREIMEQRRNQLDELIER
ncbi:DUF4124 domain-containing protein [Allohahella marinimesophila]|uniref:DUF4124 domain-containing protein n=1 Tax=Allohahella marinimesophila TaxID=1054972 RepID=A0ABP7P9V0_9GAMM